MKVITIVTSLVLLAACTARDWTENPAPDYCQMHAQTEHNLSHQHQFLYPTASWKDQEMRRLEAQKTLCDRQKSGAAPVAGTTWADYYKQANP